MRHYDDRDYDPTPTQPQVVRLYALASKAGLSHDQVKAEVLRRYGRSSTKQLRTREYEEFTRDLARGYKGISGRPEPDIAPIQEGKYISNKGGIRLVTSMLLCEESVLWPDVRDADLTLINDVLDCFRQTRTSWQRLSVDQLRKIIEAWQPYGLPAFREAADRYLRQHQDKAEPYFLGILRIVQKEQSRGSDIPVATSRGSDIPVATSRRSDIPVATSLPAAAP